MQENVRDAVLESAVNIRQIAVKTPSDTAETQSRRQSFTFQRRLFYLLDWIRTGDL